MTWTRLHLTVTTPLFNGDGDPRRAEVRVPSIRGAMRFWLRALAGITAADDLRALNRIENRVLGSTAASSPVKLRIPRQPESRYTERPEFLASDLHNRWIGYLLGLGLAGLGNDNRMRLERAHIPVGQDFELWLRFTGKDTDAHVTALAALWLALTYGGVGARTRRGFGGLRITGVGGGLPGPWAEKNRILTPGLDFYEQHTRFLWPSPSLDAAMPAVLRIARERGLNGMGRWRGHPSYPVLSREHTVAAASGHRYPSWQAVLAHAGEELKGFRRYAEDDSGKEYERPDWFGTVKGDGTDFPLGAFGLPVVFTKEVEVHADRGAGADAEPLRRASPLWLRPVGQGDEWRLFSFGFLTAFLPEDDGSAVHVWRNGNQDKEVTVTSGDAHAIVREWVSAFADDRPPVRRLPAPRAP
ncbi:type III-B CRISPR module RAMP protein Cmr1, partial [Thermobifida halotolerans]|uniref:type III-B CRISPR module RAMP protein Cmr1 n=1 Tax=Thermobifida halotolerans TaxID=483545 RepID=UPI0012F4B47B